MLTAIQDGANPNLVIGDDLVIPIFINTLLLRTSCPRLRAFYHLPHESVGIILSVHKRPARRRQIRSITSSLFFSHIKLSEETLRVWWCSH